MLNSIILEGEVIRISEENETFCIQNIIHRAGASDRIVCINCSKMFNIPFPVLGQKVRVVGSIAKKANNYYIKSEHIEVSPSQN